MSSRFLFMINRVLGHEGKYVNNPKDPGGETNWGISKRSYPHLNIAALTRDEAIEIYKRDFYDKIHGDRIASGPAYQLLDFAVNSGPETAIRYYQRALEVADDGYWGPISQAAADAMSASDQIMRIIAERQLFQTRLSTWATFGKSWARRNAQNLYYGSDDS